MKTFICQLMCRGFYAVSGAVIVKGDVLLSIIFLCFATICDIASESKS